MARATLLSFLDDCITYGDETAIVYKSGVRFIRWSYAKIASTALGLSRELQRRNINKGDRVILWGENSPEWIAAFFGCVLRGAVAVPLDVQSAPDFVGRVQQQVKARLIVVGKYQTGFPSDLAAIRFQELIDLIASQSAEPLPTAASEDDLVEIIYTSGTTSEPKGVCLTHRNILANLNPIEREIDKYRKWERFIHPVRFLNLVPLSHVFGQIMGIFIPFLLKGELVMQQSLNPSEIVETTKRNRVSVIVAVPRLLETLQEKIERDHSSRNHEELSLQIQKAASWHPLKRWWKFRQIHRQFGLKYFAFVCGGATLPAETEDFWDRLGFAVLQGYGMTETASLISVNHPFGKNRGSIGKVLPGQEVKLDDDGEILVRGSNISPGYWNENRQAPAANSDWLHTGDIAERDEGGNLFFRGRKKDVIVTAAGLNVYPEDLENALLAQSEIRDASVIGMEGANGPEPIAVLIPQRDASDIELAIKNANARLSAHQQIRRWMIWPEIDFPRTPTQKVIKRELVNAIETRSLGRVSAFNQNNVLADTIARVSGASVGNVSPSANLTTDLKLDSLGRVELLSALEDRYQIELDESAFTSATTLGDIQKIISEGPGDQSRYYPYPKWTLRFPATWIRRAALYLLIFPPVALLGWPKIRGRENLRDIKGPVLFVSNHIARVDQGLILFALPLRFSHRLAIAMDGEMLCGWRRPEPETSPFDRILWRVVYALVVTFFNVFSLPKVSGFRRSFDYAGEAMDKGYNVLIFPEGIRLDHDQMNPFKGGIGILAKSLKATIVPIKIEGLYDLKKRAKHFTRPGRISVIFGKPVDYPANASSEEITRDLEQTVSSL